MRRSVKNSEINFSQPLEVDTKLNVTLTQDNNSLKEPFLLLAKDSSHSNKDPPLNLKTVGSSKAVSFPLFRRSSHEWEEDVHPEIRYQQHINNALRRHANFLGKPIEESLLVENIYKGAEGLGLKHSDLRRRGGSLIPRQNELSVGYPRSAFASAKSGTVTPAIPVTAANSIGLSIEANDVGYFAEILVGTPPAKFKVVVDTGSSDFWLMLEECHNLKDQASSCNHPTLKSTSSTFKKTTNKFKVTYGTGKVDGVLVEETLNLGGLTLNNHVFGGVTAASDEFTGKNVPFDGLLGTAKSVLSNQKVLTPVEALTKAGLLSGSFVGYAIGRVSDTQNIGQVTFGGIDQTKFNGDLTLFPNVNKKGFWEGVMSTVTVDGATVLNQRTGILDTGTTLILAPPADVQAVHAAIPGSVPDKKGNFKIPCTTRSKVGLTFGGVNFEINPVDLTFQPAGKNLTGLCISGISAGTVGGPAQWLVGDVFLKSVYFATDIPNDQMGLAVLNRVPPKDG
ncbi:aspartic peptidase domain-containing protein [Phakopsora pachyrhizi]|nr:aspartic peptidase domain-containing protein [Phakopsora pachyrhizi]